VAILVLLLGGLACLTIGLILSSSIWLVLSLVASLVAAAMLYRARAAAGTTSTPTHADTDTAGTGPAASGRDATAVLPVVGPADAVSEERNEADGPASPPDTVTADGRPEVWVIDGRPRYHRGNCDILSGQDAEPIPLSQATEDGFIACSLCEPDVARTA